MATSHQGYQYEKNAARVLKRYDIVSKGFRPAASKSDRPDLIIQKDKKSAGCELKINPTSAGSLVLKYQFGAKGNPWSFNEVIEEEKQFIKDLVDEFKIFDIIWKKWDSIPSKFLPSQLTEQKKFEQDKKNFKEITGTIPSKKIEEYYNKKKTYYINVGTHGFFRMGDRNPLDLKDLLDFADVAKATWRARVQSKGGRYQFTFEMQFSIPAHKRTRHNIAPVSGSTVKIDEKKLDISSFH